MAPKETPDRQLNNFSKYSPVMVAIAMLWLSKSISALTSTHPPHLSVRYFETCSNSLNVFFERPSRPRFPNIEGRVEEGDVPSKNEQINFELSVWRKFSIN